MMKEITRHRDGYLDACSWQSGLVADIYAGKFDVGIWTSSWDKRCVVTTGSNAVSADYGLLILFEDKDIQGFRDKHDRVLGKYVRNQSKTYDEILGRSIDTSKIWRKLREKLTSAYKKKGSSLEIFIDASTAPRYYILGVLATCLGYGLSKRVSITYAEGAYPIDEDAVYRGEEIVFTSGQWDSVPVPGLEGEYNPSFSRFYLVSAGFEGWKTLRVVSRSDPDRVSLLFPEPGFQPEYVERAYRANAELIDQYKIPKEQIVLASAGDAVEAWKALTNASVERPRHENSYYICSGTKPHSIALALRAMSLGTPAVLYNLPEGHSVLATEPNGTYWRFEITSLTVPE